MLQTMIMTIRERFQESAELDFSVHEYDGNKMTIVGSTSPEHFHQLEIVIEGVLYVKGVMMWGSNVSQEFLSSSDAAFSTEDLESSLSFLDTDGKEAFKVSGMKIFYNLDTVFYYEKEDLKEGERVSLKMIKLTKLKQLAHQS